MPEHGVDVRLKGPRAVLALAAPMIGRHVELHPLDAAAMVPELYEVSHGNDVREAIWTYMPYGPFPSADAMGSWLDECAGRLDPIFFGVRAVGPARWIGMASFLNIALDRHRLEIGHIWYGADFHRTEAQTEASWLMLRRGLDEVGCRRVEWVCDSSNDASRRAALRMGFQEEGVLRRHARPKGRNRDTVMHALLDTEWPPVRSAFERWLATPAADRRPLRDLIDAARRGDGPEGPPLVRDARPDDLPAIVAMLADDDLGRQREKPTLPLEACYTDAFSRIEANAMSRQLVLEAGGGIAATCQVTLLPSLTHGGSTRCSIEGVRVAAGHRGGGLGHALIEWIVEDARRRGCRIVELATHRSRDRALKFYESLGFEATHHGMKRYLTDHEGDG